MEFELESRVLGDIDYHSDHPDNFQNFFDFTIEEIKQRYFEFLNLSSEKEDGHDGYEVEPGDHVNQNSNENDSSGGDLIEKDDTKLTNDMTREIDQNLHESIEEAFTDFNYWKPQVDYNLDQLLSEMNSK